jgi:large subunit ribosomal protein L29e
MAKSKNHTNHNQNFKNHRNGIKPVPQTKYSDSKSINQIYLKNKRRALKFDPTIKKDATLTKRIQVLRQNKAKIITAIRNKLIKKTNKGGDKKNEKKPTKANRD